MKRNVIIIGAIAAVILVIASIFFTIQQQNSKIKDPGTRFDSFLNATVGPAGEAPEKGNPETFTLINNQAISKYFLPQTRALVARLIGGYAIYKINADIYRAKIIDGSVVAPGNGVVTFKVEFDTPNSGTYTVAITQPPQVGITSIKITDPKGKATELYSAGD